MSVVFMYPIVVHLVVVTVPQFRAFRLHVRAFMVLRILTSRFIAD